jgi:hypothetical protein
MRDPIRHGGLNDPGLRQPGVVRSGKFRKNQFQRATVSAPRAIEPGTRGPGMRQAKVPIRGLQKREPIGLGSIVTPQSVSARAGMRANFSWPSLNFNRSKRYNPYT